VTQSSAWQCEIKAMLVILQLLHASLYLCVPLHFSLLMTTTTTMALNVQGIYEEAAIVPPWCLPP
jgi:hypothetical protein